jgi:hypothetical protein
MMHGNVAQNSFAKRAGRLWHDGGMGHVEVVPSRCPTTTRGWSKPSATFPGDSEGVYTGSKAGRAAGMCLSSTL